MAERIGNRKGYSMSDEKEPEEWKSIKVKESTYKNLKKMGKGISQAVELLVEQQKEQIETKIQDVKAVADDIAGILMEHGVFDIKFAGAGIQDITEHGETVCIKGFVRVTIPNEEARAKLVEVLKGKEEEEEEEEKENNE